MKNQQLIKNVSILVPYLISLIWQITFIESGDMMDWPWYAAMIIALAVAFGFFDSKKRKNKGKK
ncbi:hypothetical protein [Bacillus halotolerans]|uniref:hypothetical protein n=1 Tax=Bacillus halotolerans TaxID=260554 RepID=UPI002DBAC525|nr:hypothetical protein [Bacillus halotolerans]MEC3638603.1 hypothetical protein [Bacillus halotolerans]